MRLLHAILLVLALASCGESFDTAQQRLCRQAIPALNPPGTAISIERVGAGPRINTLRLSYVAGPATGPARRRSIDCMFAGEAQGLQRGALIGIASDGQPMSDASFYLLRRFYLENREEPPPDPGAPATQGRPLPEPTMRAPDNGAPFLPPAGTGDAMRAQYPLDPQQRSARARMDTAP